jgi:hypothetical protein
MSYSVKKTTITLTRGDTFKAQISITDPDGNPYEIHEGDSVRFAAKKHYTDPDTEVLIVKNIPTDSLVLQLDPADTKDLPFGEYVYDIQLTTSTGEIDTFITKAALIITEEVY